MVFLTSVQLAAQSRVFPIVKNFGGVFEFPEATEKPRADLNYKVVIEVATASEKGDDLFFSLNNIARLINLHAVGGVPPGKLEVVAVIHGEGVRAILNPAGTKDKLKANASVGDIIKELDQAGVKLLVCSQSLLSRNLDPRQVMPEVKIATSMLTTLTTYQMLGYAALKFSEKP